VQPNQSPTFYSHEWDKRAFIQLSLQFFEIKLKGWVNGVIIKLT